MSKKPHDYGVRVIGVKQIATASLYANPHNPRRLFDRQDMDALRDSIDKLGILVPLTVYKEARSGHYVILDGQRRWMCATELKLKAVPVNEVAEPDLVQNIVTMFQIHRLRKDWELMPTALKLQLLMNELDEKNPRRLAELTALDEAVVVRCKKLLSYPKRYQDMMLTAEPSSRVKADFFIELYVVRNDRFVNRLEWYDRNNFTDAMLEKIEAGGLKSVTDFRKVKQHINNAVKANKNVAIARRLREFAQDPELTTDHLDIDSARIATGARKMIAAVEKLHAQIDSIELEEYVGENEMWEGLKKLSELIRKRLRALGWRLDQ
jgi:ParB family chromosome partitioning protein